MRAISSRTAAVFGGRIEYATVGSGPTVLISHGTLGGFDQALAIAELFDQTRFSFLAPSRAGYLRSSPGTGHTPEEQARSYVELLDQLGIGSAAVMGLSGGSPSAIAVADLYPERCWALVLISSITTAPPPLPPIFRMAVRTQNWMLRFDPVWKLVFRYGLKLLMRSNNVDPVQVERVFRDPRLLRVVRGVFEPIGTSSSRRKGMSLDHAQIQALPVERADELRVPTLIAHAANDPLAPVAGAARLAESIPGAEYLESPDGGHLFFVVHSGRVVPEVERFLLANAPA